MASDLGVNLVLEGSIIRPADDQWQVDARLLAMPRGTVLWSVSVQWEAHHELPINPTVDGLVDALTDEWPGIQARLTSASE